MAQKPDDARERLHQIHRALVDLVDFPQEDATTEFCRLVEILADDEGPGAEGRWTSAKRALGIFSVYARKAAEEQVAGIDHALEIARDGSADEGPGATLRSVKGSGSAEGS